MLLVDTAKYHNCKIINTMEKQEFNETDFDKIFDAFKSGKTISNEDFARLVTFQESVIKALREELDEIHTACAEIGEENEKREEHEVQLEAELEIAKKEIENLKQRNQWYLEDWNKNKEFKESMKAVATLINTILA